MWKLTIEDDEGQRTSLELVGAEYSIGRAEDCSIRLTERNVSRTHCILRDLGDHWEIEDCDSYNGTYVNGERVVDPVPLTTNDIVQLGDYRLEVLDDVAIKAQQEVDDGAKAAAGRARRPDRLVMVIGPNPGQEFTLVGDRLAMGRAEDAHVSINHASVSRLHAEMHSFGEGRWEVVDQGSSNGIRINGVELRRGIIEPGDAIELGDVRLRFVAAGKYFRAIVDGSQQLPVVVPFESMTPAATTAAAAHAGQRGIGKILAVAAVVGVLIVGAYVLFGNSSGGTPVPASSAAPVATSIEEARAVLKRAFAVADQDITKAHGALALISEDSPVRDDDRFVEIESRWATHMLRQAYDADDKVEKKRLLNLVADTETVPFEQRQSAIDMLNEIAPGERKPLPKLQPRSPGSPKSSGSRPAPAPEPATSVAKVAPKPGPLAPPAPSTKKTGKQRYDAASNKGYLLGKAQSGTANETELRQLKATCMLDYDTACRNLAMQRLRALKKKKE